MYGLLSKSLLYTTCQRQLLLTIIYVNGVCKTYIYEETHFKKSYCFCEHFNTVKYIISQQRATYQNIMLHIFVMQCSDHVKPGGGGCGHIGGF